MPKFSYGVVLKVLKIMTTLARVLCPYVPTNFLSFSTRYSPSLFPFLSLSLSQSVSIELSYTPSLPVTAIREEALRLATEAARIGAREEALAAQQRDQESASTPEVK